MFVQSSSSSYSIRPKFRPVSSNFELFFCQVICIFFVKVCEAFHKQNKSLKSARQNRGNSKQSLLRCFIAFAPVLYPVFHVLKRNINAAFKAFVLPNDVQLFLHQALEVLQVLINHVQNVFIQALEVLEQLVLHRHTI